MSDSRSRFEAWIKSEAKARAAFRLDPAYVWQAAEAGTAKRCAEIVEGSKLNGIRSVLVNDIKAEFSEAFK